MAEALCDAMPGVEEMQRFALLKPWGGRLPRVGEPNAYVYIDLIIVSGPKYKHYLQKNMFIKEYIPNVYVSVNSIIVSMQKKKSINCEKYSLPVSINDRYH